jgi:hypothetical protein
MYFNVSPEYLYTMHYKATRRRISGTIDGVAFTGADVKDDSFEYTNRCAEESNMKIGGVFIGQLNLTFVPSFVRKVSRGSFVGRQITFSIGLYVEDNDEWEDVPVGVFTVQTANISKEGIAIEAFDNMRKFDSPFPSELTTYGEPYGLLVTVCQGCGVDLGVTRSFVESLPNGTEELYLAESNDIETCRDFIYWVAVTTGTFATIDREGRLVLRKFGNATTEIDETHRDVDAVYSDYVTKYTSVSIENLEGELVYSSLTPNDGLTMNLGANPFLQIVSDKDAQEQIAYLESENDRIDGLIEDIEDEIEVIENQIDIVEEELKDDPDNPELLARKAMLEAEKAGKEDDIEAYEKEKKDNEDLIADLQKGLDKSSKVFQKKALKAILTEVAKIEYTPFSIASARDPIFDLGDIIYLTGGIADDATCCIMSLSYKIDTFGFEGYGDNPALTDARSSTDKSVTGAKKSTKSEAKIAFGLYRNTDEISIGENDYVEIGRVNFSLSEDTDVETWVEIKMESSYNVDKLSGIQLHYFLDGNEMSYHPVAEWKDEGTVPDFTLNGRTLVFSTMESGTDSIYHTLNYQYHLSNVSSASGHVFKVMATGLEGNEIIDIGDAHITVWALGLTGDQGWEGDLSIEEELPVYPIGVVSLIGGLTEAVTASLSEPVEADKLLTEDGDVLRTETGDVMTIDNIEDLPNASALDGTEYIPVVQNGETVKITTQDIADLGNT